MAAPGAASAQIAQPAASAAALFTPVLSFSQTCEADFDSFVCSFARLFVAGELGARLHLANALSVGPYVLLGVELDQSRTVENGVERDPHAGYFASAGGEARFHPRGPRAFWLGARVGWVGVRVVTRKFDLGRTSTDDQSAPSGGVGLGYDLVSKQSVGPQFSLHCDYVAFSGSEFPTDRAIRWSPGVWVYAGVGVVGDL